MFEKNLKLDNKLFDKKPKIIIKKMNFMMNIHFQIRNNFINECIIIKKSKFNNLKLES